MNELASNLVHFVPSICPKTGIEFISLTHGNVPIVFLHGINSGANSWQYQFQSLQSSADCYAWNMPGYGHSRLYKSSPLAIDYADLLYQWANTQRFKKFILVGHSLGALIANAYAHKYSHTLLGAIFVSPTRGYGHKPESTKNEIAKQRPNLMSKQGVGSYVQQNTARLAGYLTEQKFKLVETVISNITLAGITASSHLLAYSQFNYQPLDFDLPILTLCGTLDTITPFDDVKLLSKQISSPFTAILDASHPCYLEKTDEFNLCIKQFLAKIEG